MPDQRSHVAVVDDDPLVFRGLGRLLRPAGFDVDTYASGAEFVDAAREPDCVILDLHMPQPSGFEVQRRLLSAIAAALGTPGADEFRGNDHDRHPD